MDDFLNQNKPPRPEFSRELYARLSAQAQDAAQAKPARRAINPGVRFALTALAVALGAGLLLSTPQGSAAAQSFLNLFRVKKITAIAIDPARIQSLKNGNLNFNDLFTGATEMIKKPGQPLTVTSAAQASAIMGIPVLAPAQLADGYPLGQIVVSDDATMRMTGDTNKAQALLQVLGVTDAQLPSSLNGAQITVNMPRIAAAKYGKGASAVTLAQSKAPEVDLPPDVNMAQLGEIALRALGMGADDARAMAGRIDWNNTLVVPIPINAASFREVTVRGVSGLLITANASASGPSAQNGNVLMWSEGGKVYALTGNISPTLLAQMAEAIK